MSITVTPVNNDGTPLYEKSGGDIARSFEKDLRGLVYDNSNQVIQGGNDQIRQMQQNLHDMGIDVGTIDGLATLKSNKTFLENGGSLEDLPKLSNTQKGLAEFVNKYRPELGNNPNLSIDDVFNAIDSAAELNRKGELLTAEERRAQEQQATPPQHNLPPHATGGLAIAPVAPIPDLPEDTPNQELAAEQPSAPELPDVGSVSNRPTPSGLRSTLEQTTSRSQTAPITAANAFPEIGIDPAAIQQEQAKITQDIKNGDVEHAAQRALDLTTELENRVRNWDNDPAGIGDALETHRTELVEHAADEGIIIQTSEPETAPVAMTQPPAAPPLAEPPPTREITIETEEIQPVVNTSTPEPPLVADLISNTNPAANIGAPPPNPTLRAASDANNPFAFRTGTIYGDMAAATVGVTETTADGLIEFDRVEDGTTYLMSTLETQADVLATTDPAMRDGLTLSDAAIALEQAHSFGVEGAESPYDRIEDIESRTAQVAESMGVAPDHRFDIGIPQQFANLLKGLAAYITGSTNIDQLPDNVSNGINNATGYDPNEAPAIDVEGTDENLNLSSNTTTSEPSPTTSQRAFGVAVMAPEETDINMGFAENTPEMPGLGTSRRA